jgi:hypothetical protein
MVETAVGDGAEDTVLVEPFSDLSRNHAAFGEQTVGAAIEVFEETLSGLFSFQVATPAKVQEDNKSTTKYSVAGKLLRLPLMIQLGITAAIDQNKSTHQSIGTPPSDKSALVEGNIVALYLCNHGAFVRNKGNSVDCKGGSKAIGELPFEWGAERFLVVNAGNGRIALYSPCRRQFLAARNGNAEASVYPIGNLEDRPRCNETFRIHHRGDCIELYCDIEENANSRKVHVHGQELFQVVQIHGFEPAK